MGPVANNIKLFGIIYAAIGIFPYDFDWGYTDSDVIMPKKTYKIGHYKLECLLLAALSSLPGTNALAYWAHL